MKRRKKICDRTIQAFKHLRGQINKNVESTKKNLIDAMTNADEAQKDSEFACTDTEQIKALEQRNKFIRISERLNLRLREIESLQNMLQIVQTTYETIIKE